MEPRMRRSDDRAEREQYNTKITGTETFASIDGWKSVKTEFVRFAPSSEISWDSYINSWWHCTWMDHFKRNNCYITSIDWTIAWSLNFPGVWSGNWLELWRIDLYFLISFYSRYTFCLATGELCQTKGSKSLWRSLPKEASLPRKESNRNSHRRKISRAKMKSQNLWYVVVFRGLLPGNTLQTCTFASLSFVSQNSSLLNYVYFPYRAKRILNWKNAWNCPWKGCQIPLRRCELSHSNCCVRKFEKQLGMLVIPCTVLHVF